MGTPELPPEAVSRRRLQIGGAVQGVGFRPFVFRLASDLHLDGSVANSPDGVTVEVEGTEGRIDDFVIRVQSESPPLARITSLDTLQIAARGQHGFSIDMSTLSGDRRTLVLPDVAACPECLADITDPGNRRFRYPFTNCTNCGPRFSIIKSIPYDRQNTSMADFVMCSACQREYDDPRDRRFHAQPNACADCGPHLTLIETGRERATRHDALRRAEQALKDGRIVAMKGIGGFHLLVDARNHGAVERLRSRKRRPAKPFAIMAPTIDLIREVCFVGSLEEGLLTSHEAPIVLLRNRFTSTIADNIAPDNPYLGFVLPYSPLHHLLMCDLGFPLVATSGNLSEEPICTSNRDALQRMSEVADVFLVHDRPIVRAIDDSVAQVVNDRPMLLRRARGFAPFPIPINDTCESVLGLGAHLKSAIAFGSGKKVFLSQHIGDLENASSVEAFRQTASDLPRMYDRKPRRVACDLHPDYYSTRYAEQMDIPVVGVQHHYAHVLSCMAEHGIVEPVLGIAWDGTGYGIDGTIWGGEFLAVRDHEFERVAHLRRFPLPGGDAAAREPRRAAAGLLYEIFGKGAPDLESCPSIAAFDPKERNLVFQMLDRRVNAPVTSSAGRLFDGFASLLGLRQQSEFEGQAAMDLEGRLVATQGVPAYDFGLGNSSSLDWEPMVRSVLSDLSRSVPVGAISAKIHNTFVDMIAAVARREKFETVVLTGGCFQNRQLLRLSVETLRHAGRQVFWNQMVPINDGGVALGQVMAAGK